MKNKQQNTAGESNSSAFSVNFEQEITEIRISPLM
jgi:hypothetical protein